MPAKKSNKTKKAKYFFLFILTNANNPKYDKNN